MRAVAVCPSLQRDLAPRWNPALPWAAKRLLSGLFAAETRLGCSAAAHGTRRPATLDRLFDAPRGISGRPACLPVGEPSARSRSIRPRKAAFDGGTIVGHQSK